MHSHNVFLSHTQDDQEAASRVCALLEADGIGCWLASRDAIASEDKAAATIEAIRSADLVLLIFSASANSSPYVLREIERAIGYERPVLSIHLDDAVPNPSLEYYLNLWQWLDVPGGVEDRGEEIVAAVRGQLAGTTQQGNVPEQDAVAPSEPTEEPEPGPLAEAASTRRPRRRTWVIALVCVILIATLSLGLGLGLTRNRNMWTALGPGGTRPDARAGQGMVYQSPTGLLIMFGGIPGGGAGAFNDTWAYSPIANTWTQLKPSGALPTARLNHAMALDPDTGRVIMFGGLGDDGVLNDTWAYDPAANAWTNLSPTGTMPSPRAGHSMAYDPATQRLIMFGGFDESGGRLNETWAYDPTANTWTKLSPSGKLPAGRDAHSMVYDPSSGLMIVFGGEYDHGNLNDTWAYDPVTDSWTGLSPSGSLPGERFGSAMAYDLSDGRLIMFGGFNDTHAFNDTWAYDSRANSWTELGSSGTLPPSRWMSSLTYDPATRRLVMFGGRTKTVVLSNTWSCEP